MDFQIYVFHFLWDRTELGTSILLCVPRVNISCTCSRYSYSMDHYDVQATKGLALLLWKGIKSAITCLTEKSPAVLLARDQLVNSPSFFFTWDAVDVILDTYTIYMLENRALIEDVIYQNFSVNLFVS